MTELFGRAVRITLGDVQFTGLDVEFNVERSLKAEPNTCELRIYNLGEERRAAITAQSGVTVRLEVGYDTQLFTLFEGDLRDGGSQVSGPDVVTTLRAGDGEKTHRTNRPQRSYRPGSGAKRVREDAVGGFGVGLGNALTTLAGLSLQDVGTAFETGFVVHGRSTKRTQEVLRAAGAELSVQDGELQILPVNKPLAGLDVLLTPDTGLIDSPSIDSDGDLSARALIQPNLVPGATVQVRAKTLTGDFRIERVTYRGATAGNEWSATLEGKSV